MEELNTVTYNFEDGTKVVQPIKKQCYFNEKGHKKSIQQLHDLFFQTCWDKKAISYNLEAVELKPKSIKEAEFTKKEKANAKKDYGLFKSENLNKFNLERKQFQTLFVDKFINSKFKIRYNVQIIIK